MAFSTLVITLVGWYITDKIVEPRLGEYNGEINSEEMESLTPAEQKGLRWAGYSLLAFVAFLLLLVLFSSSRRCGLRLYSLPHTMIASVHPHINTVAKIYNLEEKPCFCPE